mmetsp:Transcript_131366/g.420450  ORF Transcript_131366/g.420450 Transcript_131366/m.420450 type:complete len:359 (+) Transcript_131366:480-1556(+)
MACPRGPAFVFKVGDVDELPGFPSDSEVQDASEVPQGHHLLREEDVEGLGIVPRTGVQTEGPHGRELDAGLPIGLGGKRRRRSDEKQRRSAGRRLRRGEGRHRAVEGELLLLRKVRAQRVPEEAHDRPAPTIVAAAALRPELAEQAAEEGGLAAGQDVGGGSAWQLRQQTKEAGPKVCQIAHPWEATHSTVDRVLGVNAYLDERPEGRRGHILHSCEHGMAGGGPRQQRGGLHAERQCGPDAERLKSERGMQGHDEDPDDPTDSRDRSAEAERAEAGHTRGKFARQLGCRPVEPRLLNSFGQQRLDVLQAQRPARGLQQGHGAVPCVQEVLQDPWQIEVLGYRRPVLAKSAQDLLHGF